MKRGLLVTAAVILGFIAGFIIVSLICAVIGVDQEVAPSISFVGGIAGALLNALRSRRRASVQDGA